MQQAWTSIKIHSLYINTVSVINTRFSWYSVKGEGCGGGELFHILILQMRLRRRVSGGEVERERSDEGEERIKREERRSMML